MFDLFCSTTLEFSTMIFMPSKMNFLGSTVLACLSNLKIWYVYKENEVLKLRIFVFF